MAKHKNAWNSSYMPYYNLVYSSCLRCLSDLEQKEHRSLLPANKINGDDFQIFLFETTHAFGRQCK